MRNQKHFEKSVELESLLGDLNESLKGAELFPTGPPKLPTILIMGVPRSGTTLMLQTLAASGRLGYPSNLIARFYGNPSIGVAVQRVLIENDHERQLWPGERTWRSDSQLGRTYGALAPSEFWYYWRRFFPFEDEHRLDDEVLAKVDVEGFLGGIGAMEMAVSKPLVMKGMMMAWHIPFLARINKNFIFLHIERDLCDTAISVLRSREVYAGSCQDWWSFKPPGYKEWLSQDPVEQVARQVYAIDKATKDGLSLIPKERVIRVSYDDFCLEPNTLLEEIGRKILNEKNALLGPNFVRESIKVSNQSEVSNELKKRMCREIDECVKR